MKDLTLSVDVYVHSRQQQFLFLLQQGVTLQHRRHTKTQVKGVFVLSVHSLTRIGTFPSHMQDALLQMSANT